MHKKKEPMETNKKGVLGPPLKNEPFLRKTSLKNTLQCINTAHFILINLNNNYSNIEFLDMQTRYLRNQLPVLLEDVQRCFTLDDAMLEYGISLAEQVEDITLFPPENATAEVTDEDSGDDDKTSISNLPGPALRARAEVNVRKVLEKADNISSHDDFTLTEII